MRKPFIAANWKMHKNVQESVEFVDAIKGKLPDPQDCLLYTSDAADE